MRRSRHHHVIIRSLKMRALGPSFYAASALEATRLGIIILISATVQAAAMTSPRSTSGNFTRLLPKPCFDPLKSVSVEIAASGESLFGVSRGHRDNPRPPAGGFPAGKKQKDGGGITTASPQHS